MDQTKDETGEKRLGEARKRHCSRRSASGQATSDRLRRAARSVSPTVDSESERLVQVHPPPNGHLRDLFVLLQ